MDKRDEAMKVAIEALVKELSRDLIASERVVAISKAIESLKGINSLSRIDARFVLALPTQEILITESFIEYEKSIKEGFVPVNAPDMKEFTGLNIWISYKPCGSIGCTGLPR